MFTMIECYILYNKLLKNGDKDMNKILIVDDNKQIVTILSEYAKKITLLLILLLMEKKLSLKLKATIMTSCYLML